MRDLNDILASNTKATIDAIPAEVQKGRHVVAKYTGLNFLGYDCYPDANSAVNAAADFQASCPGNRAVVHHPVLVGLPDINRSEAIA